MSPLMSSPDQHPIPIHLTSYELLRYRTPQK
jgi:hypothetical protein